VSLLKVLQIYAHRFVKLLENLQIMEHLCATAEPHIETLGPLLHYLEIDCDCFGLLSSKKQLNRVHGIVTMAIKQKSVNLPTLSASLTELHTRILEDLEETVFFTIGPETVKTFFKKVMEQDELVLVPKTVEDLFGQDVVKLFPGAAQDLNESVKCFVSSRYTACVFQSMRVAEHGLRRLAKRLKVTLTHSGHSCPVEFADWDKVITGIRNKLIAIRQLPQGLKRQTQLEMYSDAADHCTFMKDIWRNNVSHTRKPYLEPEALAVLGRVGDFMKFSANSLARLAP
jgi:hypothetical protein